MEMYLNQIGSRISELVGGYIPTLVAALLVLIVGWLVALIIARAADRVLHHSGLSERLNRIASGTGAAAAAEAEPGRWVRKLVFWLIMLFVFIAFFQVLGISRVTDPLNQLLTKVFDYTPLLLGAGLLLVIAWIVASVLKFLVARGLTAAKLDERLRSEAGIDVEKQLPLTKAISETVYWLIFLLFLPAVLGALQLEGLLRPVQEMLDKILAVLPNIFAAAVVLFVGWFVARILQRIVTNLMAASGIDRLSDKVGVSAKLKTHRLSGLIGMVIYFLVLVPVIVATFNVLGLDAITQPTTNMLNMIMAALPGIFAAVLVLVIAYIVGRVVVELIVNLLTSIGFNRVLAKLGIGKEPTQGARTPSEIVGYLVMVAIMFFAAIEASHLMGFNWLVNLGTQFTVFAGQVLLGLLIFGVGLFLANLVSKTVLAGGSSQAKLLAVASRVAILVLTGAMALRQMGLADDIVNLAFGLMLGAIAVAIALAFGLGGREIASRELGQWLNATKAKTEKKNGQ